MSLIEMVLAGFVVVVLAVGVLAVLIQTAGEVIRGEADWVETILTIALWIIVGLSVYWAATGRLTT